MLYRVFPWVTGAVAGAPGGPLHVPRERQGVGRHDNPGRYGALYVSRSAESAIAERIQAFRGQTLTDADLQLVGGARYALATFAEVQDRVVDLDDPAELLARALRPSKVATHDRAVTRAWARSIFDEGVNGFSWWSSLESSWANVTLFAERVVDRIVIVKPPEVLTLDHPAVELAAETIGVRLAP